MPKGLGGRWVMAGAVGLLGYVVWGVGFYTMPVFYVPLEAEFHWSRTALTFVGALTILSYSLGGPVVGALADSFGVRRILIAGVALFGLSLALFAAGADTLAVFYVVGCANGVACGLVSLLPSQILVARWFDERRAAAMGFILMLMALGGVVNAALAGSLIARFGWRPAAVIFGAMVWLVALPVSLFVVRDSPAGARPGRGGAAADSSDEPTLGDAFRGAQFYVLCGAVFCNMAVGNALLQNTALHVSDLGHGLKYGAFVMSGLVFANLAARLVVGVVIDRTSIKFGMLLSYACMGAAAAAYLSASSKPVLLAAGLLAGFAYGGSILSLPLMSAAVFGTRALGKILGTVLLCMGLGSASGTFIVGRVFDATRSYHSAFLPLLFFGLASLVLAGLLSPRAYSRAASGRAAARGFLKPALGKRD